MLSRSPHLLIVGLCLALPLSTHTLASESSPTTDDKPQLEIVRVYGSADKLKLENEQALTPGGVTIVDGEELQQRNVTNLADMLRFVPGVWSASGSTGDGSFYSSRGSNLDAVNYDGNGIKLLQDGLPITAADGNNHNRTIDPLSVRYAVVARGANALTYGASTLGGAIDFMTPTARDSAPGEVQFHAGSHGQVQSRLSAGTVAGPFDGLITLEARRWEGYRNHFEQDRESLYANAGWVVNDDTQTRFYFNHIDNDQQLPGSLTAQEVRDKPKQAQAANASGNHQYNVTSWRLANKTEWQLSENGSLTAGISYEEQDLYHPIVSSPFFTLLIDTEQRNLGTTLRYHLHLGDHNLLMGMNYGDTVVAGGNYSHNQGVRTALMTRVDNKADSLELFVMDRWQFLPQWTAIYGAQLVDATREVRNVSASSGAVRNPKANYDSINPRVGLIHQLSDDVELFTNLSRLYEAPTTYELEDDVRSNEQTLAAMHGTVIEFGGRGEHALDAYNLWHWDVAVYYGELRDEILSIDDPAAPGTSLAANIDSTVHAGVEALIGASLALGDSASHRLEPQLSLTVNEFFFDNDPVYQDNRLPAAPGFVIKGEVLYRNDNGFYVGPTFDIIDDRYADFVNTYTVKSYALLGLRTGTITENWEAFIEVRNLADKNYIALHSVRNQASASDAILQPGEPRSVYAGMKYKF